MVNQIASEEMIKEALGDDADDMAQPPLVSVPTDHVLWSGIENALREIYDPEIPVNIYELGLIYKVTINDETNTVDVVMSLTAPGCPVAEEMPIMVSEAIKLVDGIDDVTVDVVWDPTWDPSFMAETARLTLNMY